MVAFVLAGAYRGEVRRRPHRRRPRGPPRLRGADRMAFVLIGFMGAGKSTVARRAGRGARRRAARQRRAAGGAPRALGRRGVRAARRGGRSGPRRRSSCASCWAMPAPRDVIALGGGSVLSERVREALAAHLTVLLDVDPAVAWERVHAPTRRRRASPARDREAFLALVRRERCGAADACQLDDAKASAAPPGPAAVGERRVGRLPGVHRPRAAARERAARQQSGRSTARRRVRSA